MRRHKVALFSTSVGAGHTRAAQALESVASDYPLEVEHVDTLSLMPRAFGKLYRDAYLDVVEHAPQVFSWLFELTDKPFQPDAIRLALEEASARKFYKFLKSFQPDLVLCTHFLPTTLAFQGREKGRGNYCIATVITDFDVHGMWLAAPSDHYFVAVPEARAYLRSFGVSSRAITVSGIPTHPSFHSHGDRKELAVKLGLNPELPTILLSAGGLGSGRLDETLKAIREVRKRLQVIVVCGRNEELRRSVEELATRSDGKEHLVHPLGFTHEFHHYMTCSDVMIGKPGGMTTWESMVKGLPWIVVDPIPGQEERNTYHLLEAGIAMWAYEPRTLAYKIEKLLEGDRLQRMTLNARALAKPESAAEILNVCSELLH